MKVLYHYCSNSRFISIVQNRSIRLSSLSLSNDSMEGKLVTELLVDIARNSNLDNIHIDRLKYSVGNLNQLVDGLGFCLSEERDLLSQWRGYADDANGVAIGFSKKYLEELADGSLVDGSKDKNISGFSLHKVEYDVDKQKKLIEPTYIEIKKLIDQGAFRVRGIQGLLDSRSEEEVVEDNEKTKTALTKYSMATISLFAILFILKSSAFREEKEWRLISYFINSGSDICEFHSQLDAIVPFRAYSLKESELPPIVEVVLGPKNMTPHYVVKNLLIKYGFDNVKVTSSKASYR